MAEDQEEVTAQMEVSGSEMAAAMWPSLVANQPFLKALAASPDFVKALQANPLFTTAVTTTATPAATKATAKGLSR